MFQSIECPECKRLPLFDFDFENNHCIFKLKCHNKQFEEISLDKFMNLFKEISSNFLLWHLYLIKQSLLSKSISNNGNFLHSGHSIF